VWLAILPVMQCSRGIAYVFQLFLFLLYLQNVLLVIADIKLFLIADLL